MKGQVKPMSDDNLPFWTSILSWVKSDWWKTILTIVTVVLLILCGPCILQCVVNLYHRGWINLLTYIPGNLKCSPSRWVMLILEVETIKRGLWGRKGISQANSILKNKDTPSCTFSELWTMCLRAMGIWFRSYLNGLVVFPTFFNISLNLVIRSSWSEPQLALGLVLYDCIELLHLWLQRI